jgi:hypothetical protein
MVVFAVPAVTLQEPVDEMLGVGVLEANGGNRGDPGPGPGSLRPRGQRKAAGPYQKLSPRNAHSLHPRNLAGRGQTILSRRLTPMNADNLCVLNLRLSAFIGG